MTTLRRRSGGELPHPILDRSGLGVLVVLLGDFVAPTWVAWAYRSHEAAPGGLVELRMLVGAALLGLVLPLLQIGVHARRVGGDAVRGNRDDFPALDGIAARMPRAHANLVESLLPFAIGALSARALHVSNDVTVLAADAFFAARCVHAATYVAGVPIVRSAAFYAGVLATVVLATQLPLLR